MKNKSMQGNVSKWTKPERRFRMLLVRSGVKHVCHWPVTGTRRVSDFKVGRHVVFVDGRFWHDPGRFPKSTRGFWPDKIRRNAERDRDTDRIVRRLGLIPLRVWDDEPEAWLRALSRLRAPPFASSEVGRSSRRRTRAFDSKS